MRPEPRGPEGNGGPNYGLSRTKVGLETPLSGRFWGENKRLLFAPPLWYDWFVRVVFAGGVLAAFLGYFLQILPWLYPTWWLFTGVAVAVAGVLGYLSTERMTIDLRQRTYTRREGAGVLKRVTRGSLNDIDALVIQASENLTPSLIGRTVIYRLVLFWKNGREPLLICERFPAAVPSHAAINAGAGMLLQKGQRYAKEMQLPFYDNSHFHSNDPQRFI